MRLKELQRGITTSLDRVVAMWQSYHPDQAPYRLLLSPLLSPVDEAIQKWSHQTGLPVKYDAYIGGLRAYVMPHPDQVVIPKIEPGEELIPKRSAGRGKKRRMSP